MRGVAGVEAHPQQQRHADRGEYGASAGQQPRPDPGQQLARDPGRDDDPAAERQEGQAGLERAVAQGLLEVEGEEQEHREQAGAGEQRGQERPAAVTFQRDPQRQQRRGGPHLDHDERDEQCDRTREQPQRAGVAPAVVGGHGEAVDERDEPRGHHQRAGQVVTGPALGAALPHNRRGGECCDQRDRYVDQQAPPPRGVLGEQTTEYEADRRATAGDRAVHAEGAGPLLALGEGDRDQGERGRCEHRGERALQRAGGEQQPGVGRETTQRRGEREPDQTPDEGALAADIVGDPAAEQQQTAEGEGVGRHHPLPVGGGDVQRVLRVRQGDVHDGRVEHDHELRDGDDRQRQPAPWIGSVVSQRRRIMICPGGDGIGHEWAPSHNNRIAGCSRRMAAHGHTGAEPRTTTWPSRTGGTDRTWLDGHQPGWSDRAGLLAGLAEPACWRHDKGDV